MTSETIKTFQKIFVMTSLFTKTAPNNYNNYVSFSFYFQKG